MKKETPITLTQTDHKKLTALAQSVDNENGLLLEEELSRATVVSDETRPENTVGMNSKVRFQDLESKEEMTVTLVYPHEANADKNLISILSPIGSALIGLQVGQTISWPLPNGKQKSIKVISVQG